MVQKINVIKYFRFPICEATNGKETTGLAGVVNKGLGLAEKGLQQVGLSTDQVSWTPNFLVLPIFEIG